MIVETYSLHRQGVVALVAAAVAVMGFFVLFSSGLVNDLEEQERQRMELWAEAPAGLRPTVRVPTTVWISCCR